MTDEKPKSVIKTVEEWKKEIEGDEEEEKEKKPLEELVEMIQKKMSSNKTKFAEVE